MKYLSVITLLTVSIVASGQYSGHFNAVNITGSNNFLRTEIPLANPQVLGSTYLIENWSSADIVVKDSLVVHDIKVRLEIEQGLIELLLNDKTKYIALKDVQSVKIHSQSPIVQSASLYSYKGTRLNGLVEVYKGTKYTLVKQYYIEFIKANYNVALDVGSKNHRKVKKVTFFILDGSNLILVKGSSKKVAAQFSADREKALTLLKTNNLKLSSETDVFRFVTLLNE
jgi:hypothetical protein